MKNWAASYFDQEKLAQARDVNDILKFTPDLSYSTGNFSMLREKHTRLQLDSVNGTNDRMNTLLRRTNWPADFFKGKTILECGCGAGPDTEILLKLGARIISADLAGSEKARENLKNDPNVQLIQASIMDLPLQKKSFDIVFCHRVLQHTPDPRKTLDHILQFVKDDGAVFVHSYARTPRQMFRWKYVLLPITRRMDPQKLYRIIEKSAPFLYKISSFMYQFGRPGTLLAEIFIPFCNYSNKEQFKDTSPEFLMELGIHDTFDALSPPYDSPTSMAKMREIAERYLKKPFEVVYVSNRTVTLLRSVLSN